MAEPNEVQTAGALTQVQQAQQPSPAMGMVPGIAGGNVAIDEMMRNMITNGQQRQGYLEQQQKAYNNDLSKYAQMVEQSRTPEATEAYKWGNMAQAAAKVAPTWGNTGAMIAGIGGAYGDTQQQILQNDIKNQFDLTKTRQAEVRALEAKDQQAQLMKSLMPKEGKIKQAKDTAGNLYFYNDVTNAKEVIPSNHEKTYLEFFKKGAQVAQAQDVADKEGFARDYALRMMRSIPGGVTPYDTTQKPVVPIGTEQSEPTPQDVPVKPGAKAPTKIPEMNVPLEAMSPEDQDTVNRLIVRSQANPKTAQATVDTINKILAKYPSVAKAPESATPMQTAPVSSEYPADAPPGLTPVALAKWQAERAKQSAEIDAAQKKAYETKLGGKQGEQAAEEPTQFAKVQSLYDTTKQFSADLGKLEKHPGLSGITGIQGYFPNIRGRDAANAEALLNTVQSKIVGSTIALMKAQSATGATGYGALSQEELKILKDSIESISTSQSKDAIIDNLKIIQDTMKQAQKRNEEAFYRQYPKSTYQVDKAGSPSTEQSKVDHNAAMAIIRGGK